MPSAPTLILLTLFACPNGETQEARCGPATGNYATTSIAECHTLAMRWKAEQVRMDTGLQTLRHLCWAPGIGTQKP